MNITKTVLLHKHYSTFMLDAVTVLTAVTKDLAAVTTWYIPRVRNAPRQNGLYLGWVPSGFLLLGYGDVPFGYGFDA